MQLYLDFEIDFMRECLKASTRKKNETINLTEVNDEMHGFAYSYFSDLINRSVLGCSAKKFKELHGLDKNGNIRDYLKQYDPEKFELLERAERLETKLISSKANRKKIKKTIEKLCSIETIVPLKKDTSSRSEK